MEAIIFDYGGVLCLHPSEERIDELAALCGVDRETFLPNYWAPRVAYDRGDFESGEYWRIFSKSVNREYTPEHVEEIRRRDIASWMTLDERMIEWVRALRASKIKVGLISNLPRDLGEHLRHHTDVFSLFDHVTLSYEQRCVKPDAPIYLECCKGLGIAPGGALFLDDREPNVRGAEAAGLKSIVFESADRLAVLLRASSNGLLPRGAPLL